MMVLQHKQGFGKTIKLWRKYEIYQSGKWSVNKDMLLLMTYQEACEIRDDLERFISSDKLHDHSHINEAEFKHELTLSIYDENYLDGYQDNIKKWILE